MKRRHFITTGIVATGSIALAGRGGAAVEPIPTEERPRYADWIPATGYNDSDVGVFFAHFDWETPTDAEGVDSEDIDQDDDGFRDPDVEPIIESYPILELPLFGSSIAPAALFGILPYPFSEDVLPDGPPAEGVATTGMTWIDDVVVFHGEYDPEIFAEWYAEEFERTDEREGFDVYVGDDEDAENLAYAVSEEALVVGLHLEDDDNTAEEPVTHLLDTYLGETERVIDDEDGAWLFETTGEASIAFGTWGVPDPEDALDPDDDEVVADVGEPEAEPDVETNPVFDGVESLVNTVSFGTDDDPDGLEARYAGLYPEDSVPTEGDVRRHLVGGAFVPHDLAVEGNRVYARVTFEDEPV